jgi:hypothetical protein
MDSVRITRAQGVTGYKWLLTVKLLSCLMSYTKMDRGRAGVPEHGAIIAWPQNRHKLLSWQRWCSCWVSLSSLPSFSVRSGFFG